MPVVLMLFAIALVITCIGIFLSPKSQSRQAPPDYPVVPREKSVARAIPGSARANRWTEMIEPDATVKPLTARSGKMQTQAVRSQAVTLQPIRPQVTKRALVSAVDAGLWGRLSSWKVVVPGLATLFLLSFYLLNMTLPHPLLWTPAFFGTTNPATTPVSSSQSTSPTYTASRDLVRLGQLNANQYNSTQEYNTWSYSACSAAAMTEVINAYGHTYRVTDILTVEAKIHEITPQEGLLEESGIQHTGAQFGFKTTWGHNLSLDQVIAAANRGTPVIVSFPPSRYPGGHILVVRGGTASTVDLADSSLLNWTQITRARFLQLWGGFSAIMTPN